MRVPYTRQAAANYMQLFQTEHYVAILQEFIHEVRIIPVGSGPPPLWHPRQWIGLSHGYWDGDALVVETSRFNGLASFQGAGSDLRLVERFTRSDADTLEYEFTVNDPESFTRPWSARMSMKVSDSA